MKGIITTAIILVAIPSVVCLGGNNPNGKVAVHVISHDSTRTCTTLPTITTCEDIVFTYEGCGDVDFFPVFYGLVEYQGFDYSVNWPTAWGSCAYTSCSDLSIGGITNPGDGVSHAWQSCQASSICIPGFGWLTASTAGRIKIRAYPGAGNVNIGDCEGGLDTPILNSRAGVCGGTGDNPCGQVGPPEGAGYTGGVRGIYEE